MGVSTGNMSHWKKGRLPKGKTLRRMAQFFRVPVDYLIGAKPNSYAAQQERVLSLLRSVPEDAREAFLHAAEQAAAGLQKEEQHT